MADIPWTWWLIRATGLTAWILLTLVVFWGLLLRTRLLGSIALPPSLLNMHRWLGALSISMLAIHMGLLLIDPAVTFTLGEILIPFTAPWNSVAVGLGGVALYMMLPVTVIGRIRSKLGSHGAALFKRSHLLAYWAWPVATAHYVLAGTDAMRIWSLAMLGIGTALLVFGLLTRGFVPAPARKPARSHV